MKITRRHVLAAMAAVPAVGAAAAGGLALRWWDRPPGEGLRRLSVDEHDFVVALAEAWLPAGGTPALSGADAELGRFLDEVIDGMAPETGTQLKLLLQALDDLPRLTRLSAFRHLPLADRTDVLRSWMHTDQWLLRNGVQALLVLMGTGYTTHPEVVETLRPWFACGYGR
jgi:hypothetical protein